MNHSKPSIITLLIFTIQFYSCFGQSVSISQNQQYGYSALQQHVYGQLDLSTDVITTGILLDHSLGSFEATERDGLQFDPAIESEEQFGMLYNLLYYGQVNSQSNLPTLNQIEANAEVDY